MAAHPRTFADLDVWIGANFDGQFDSVVPETRDGTEFVEIQFPPEPVSEAEAEAEITAAVVALVESASSPLHAIEWRYRPEIYPHEGRVSGYARLAVVNAVRAAA